MITVDGAGRRRRGEPRSSPSTTANVCSAMYAAPPMHDDAREEAVGVEAHEPRAQARDEPEVGECRAGEERSTSPAGAVARAAAPAGRAPRTRTREPAASPASRGEATTSKDEADARAVRRARLGRGGGLARRGRTCLSQRAPRPRRLSRLRAGSEPAQRLAARLQAFFAGGAGRLSRRAPADRRRVLRRLRAGAAGGARAARSSPTASSRRSRAGRARRARPGTFCARCELAPFLPVHRVVSSNGIGSWGTLGVEYKRRLLELEHVAL